MVSWSLACVDSYLVDRSRVFFSVFRSSSNGKPSCQSSTTVTEPRLYCVCVAHFSGRARRPLKHTPIQAAVAPPAATIFGYILIHYWNCLGIGAKAWSHK